jgi:hypothetical protein
MNSGCVKKNPRVQGQKDVAGARVRLGENCPAIAMAPDSN